MGKDIPASTSGLFVHTEKYTNPHGHTHSNKYKVIGSDSECGCESWQAEAVGRHRATVSLAWGGRAEWLWGSRWEKPAAERVHHQPRGTQMEQKEKEGCW